MVDSRKIKALMMENGYTQREIARVMNITPIALNAKINNRALFSIKQAAVLCELLQIENPTPIFFVKDVAKTATNCN